MQANASSSRAHTKLTITSTVTLAGPGACTRVGSLCLVDLAGCERAGEAALKATEGEVSAEVTAAAYARLAEGIRINRDLGFLRDVLKAKATHASKEALGVLIRTSSLTLALAAQLGFGAAAMLVVHVPSTPSLAARADALPSLGFGKSCQ